MSINEILPVRGLTLEAVDKLGEKQLLSVLKSLSSIGRDAATWTARAFAAYEKNGYDLDKLPEFAWSREHLRKIAAGTISPEAATRFGGRPMVLKTLSALPVAEQTKLATGTPVKVAERGKSGWDHRNVDAAELSRDQLRVAIDPSSGKVRSLAEQQHYLEAEAKIQAKPTPKPARIQIDAKRNGLLIRGEFFPLSEIAAKLEELADTKYEEETGDGVPMKVTVTMTPKEHAAFKYAMAKNPSGGRPGRFLKLPAKMVGYFDQRA